MFLLTKDGRVVDDAESPLCTHLVVGPEARDIPFELHPQLHVVRAEVKIFFLNLKIEMTIRKFKS